MTQEVLDQISSYYFCGNFGDPILNNDLIEMCEYSARVSPDTGIRIHTNGGGRTTQWWAKLAKTLPKNHSVIFAIDGLAGTHELYRIGTTFEKVIANASAFINAGGRAEWAFIRFKHNEHQVEECRQLATKLKFATFTMKDSSRFLLDKQFAVYNKRDQITHYMEPSEYSEIKFIDRKAISNYKSIVANTEIRCQALDSKEVYIDAFGRVFPCCYLAMIPYIPLDTEFEITAIRQEILKEYNALVADLGGIDAVDGRLRSVKDIVDSTPYQTVWHKYWNEEKLITCTRSCGVTTDFSNPRDQFTSVESL
jgi:MoaA/NifB/PqqE/SkfB family radical SAM enzyme